MSRNRKMVSVRGNVMVLFVFLTAIVLENAFIINPGWYWALFITMPVLLVVATYKSNGHLNY